MDPYVQSLVDQSRQLKLGDSRAWQKILYISDSQLLSKRSMVDDADFFLSSAGKSNPQAELEASLVAFYKPDKISLKKEPPKHPQCIYTARWFFLKKHLKIDPKKFPVVPCEDFERYRELAQYTGVSLVFSSYFINSPASMFGHTFLRMHREQDGRNQNGLLDDAANFAAHVPRYIAPLYPLQGLLGFFPGRFSLLPYFQKIQEYNNYESRDLWEYRLNFSKDEIDFLTYVLYEIGHFYIDYYYLDENCSYILNVTLEAAKPELHITGNMYLYAIPVDTLKTVVAVPGLAKDVKFRPSSFTRFKHRVEKLTPPQQKIFKKVVAENNIGELDQAADCDQSCQVNILDTVVEYIDFDEKLSGMREAETFAALRRQSLGKRAKLKVPSQPMDPFPLKEIPDRGHWSSTVGLKSGWASQNKSATYFQWKPALQDLDAHTQAYGNQMQLSFFDTQVAYMEQHKQLYIESFKLLELFSLPGSVPGHSPWGWYVTFGGDTLRRNFASGDRLSRYYFEIGSGLAWYFNNRRGQFYLFGHANLGYGADRRAQFYIAPLVHSGFRYRFSDEFQMHLETRYEYLIGRENWEFWRSKLRFTYYPTVDQELFVEGGYQNNAALALLGFRVYY